MADPPTALRARCLCLDIETARHDRLVLREIGVFRPDLDARLRLSGKAPDLVRRLDALTEGAAFVLGHNVVAFDQPALAALHPGLALHRLPLIDTRHSSARDRAITLSLIRLASSWFSCFMLSLSRSCERC